MNLSEMGRVELCLTLVCLGAVLELWFDFLILRSFCFKEFLLLVSFIPATAGKACPGLEP